MKTEMTAIDMKIVAKTMDTVASFGRLTKVDVTPGGGVVAGKARISDSIAGLSEGAAGVAMTRQTAKPVVDS
jgi:hypothetical protein